MLTVGVNWGHRSVDDGNNNNDDGEEGKTIHRGNENSTPLGSHFCYYYSPSSMLHHLRSSFPGQAEEHVANNNGLLSSQPRPDCPSAALARPKRRRVKCRKNKEEIENQRMTHIAVERNRRKRMNQYLSLLRSLMPASFVQRVSLFLSFFAESSFISYARWLREYALRIKKNGVAPRKIFLFVQ